jgi:hypothetical protein
MRARGKRSVCPAVYPQFTHPLGNWPVPRDTALRADGSPLRKTSFGCRLAYVLSGDRADYSPEFGQRSANQLPCRKRMRSRSTIHNSPTGLRRSKAAATLRTYATTVALSWVLSRSTTIPGCWSGGGKLGGETRGRSPRFQFDGGREHAGKRSV